MAMTRWILVMIAALTVCSCDGMNNAPPLKPSHGTPAAPESDTILPDVGPVVPWTNKLFANDPREFQFAIVSDRTGKPEPGVFPAAMRKLNLLRPEFVMSVGDFIEGYTASAKIMEQEWKQVETVIDTLEVPFFYVEGNHDVSDEQGAYLWRARRGPHYYWFLYRDVLFLCLTTDYPKQGRISPEQIEYFRKVLGKHRKVRWTLVFLHRPLWLTAPETSGWREFQKLIDNRDYTVLSGHVHQYLKARRNGRDHYALSSTGARVPTETDPEFGRFYHVTWVTMTNAGPRIANILLDGILPDNVRDEAKSHRNARLFRNSYVAMGSMYATNGRFTGGKTSVLLRNAADVEVEMSVDITCDKSLTVSPSRIVRRCSPGNLVVPLTVTVNEPVKPGATFDVRLDYTIQCEIKGRKPLYVKRSTAGKPTRTWQVKPSARPVTVDANLDDWDNLPFVVADNAHIKTFLPKNHTGPEDCSYRFGVAYDKEFLYIAVRTTDDSVVLDGKLPLSQRDGLEIMLDGRDDPVRSANGRRDPFKHYLQLGMAPLGKGKVATLLDADKLPKGVVGACRADDRGLTAELAVPLPYLANRQKGNWKAVRLNISVNDCDPKDHFFTQIMWQAPWTAMGTPGSGTLLRADAARPAAKPTPKE